jgi:hypothetical protein
MQIATGETAPSAGVQRIDNAAIRQQIFFQETHNLKDVSDLTQEKFCEPGGI